MRQNHYSVPARYVGRRLSIRFDRDTVTLLDGGTVVGRHDRLFGRYLEALSLDHYLEVLVRKPGALPGATALAQAKACGAFTRRTNGIGTRPAGSWATPAAPAPW